MSRIGKQIITIPAGVTVTVSGDTVTVKGPKGELKRAFPKNVTVTVADNSVTSTVTNPEEKTERSLWGTVGAHLRNMVKGVTEGFTKELEINGVGYRVAMQGKDLKLEVGFSHPVIFQIPAGIQASVEKNQIRLVGFDKDLLGNTAAELRAVKKPEPYKGKGIKYLTEIVRRKAGKTASKGA